MTLAVVGAAVLGLTIAGLVGWRLLRRHFIARYHRETCKPREFQAADLEDSPVRYHLEDIPWIATSQWTCSANSLAMVAAQHGVDASVDHCNFLMGFTYGASQVPGSITVHFFGEPEAGLEAAAPYLGLARRYYVTDDADRYLSALRSYLSRGYAVRVGLDVAHLYDLPEPSPHSDLLVGYDEEGFRYYETVCLPEAPCQPGSRPPGAEGLWISDRLLLEAVLGQAELFSYPWRYAFTVFEHAEREEDLDPVFARNGKSLLGIPFTETQQYGPAQGADAIDGLAAAIETRGPHIDPAQIAPPLEAAAYTRRANALYLREAFPHRTDVARAAAHLETAAEHYAAVVEALKDDVADQPEAACLAAALRQAAAAERHAGQIFLDIAN